MDQRLADLLQLLELEQLEVNLFRGESRDSGAPQVFGGQVLGQALSAAAGTVDGRVVHSLHAYFLRRGDCNAPIVYEVDRSLDGHSFSNRRVVAIQHGQQIFNMTASFQVSERASITRSRCRRCRTRRSCRAPAGRRRSCSSACRSGCGVSSSSRARSSSAPCSRSIT